MAEQGVPEKDTGRVYDPKSEWMANVVGQRMQSLDVEKSLHFKATEFTEGKEKAAGILSEVLKRPGMLSDSELRQGYQNMDRQRRVIYEEFRKDVVAAGKLGMSQEEIIRTLHRSGVSMADAESLLTGRYIPLLPPKPKPGVPLDEATRRQGVLVEEFRSAR